MGSENGDAGRTEKARKMIDAGTRMTELIMELRRGEVVDNNDLDKLQEVVTQTFGTSSQRPLFLEHSSGILPEFAGPRPHLQSGRPESDRDGGKFHGSAMYTYEAHIQRIVSKNDLPDIPGPRLQMQSNQPESSGVGEGDERRNDSGKPDGEEQGQSDSSYQRSGTYTAEVVNLFLSFLGSGTILKVDQLTLAPQGHDSHFTGPQSTSSTPRTWRHRRERNKFCCQIMGEQCPYMLMKDDKRFRNFAELKYVSNSIWGESLKICLQ